MEAGALDPIFGWLEDVAAWLGADNAIVIYGVPPVDVFAGQENGLKASQLALLKQHAPYPLHIHYG